MAQASWLGQGQWMCGNQVYHVPWGLANLSNSVSSEAVHRCLLPCPNTNEDRSRAAPQWESLVKKVVGMWISSAAQDRELTSL